MSLGLSAGTLAPMLRPPLPLDVKPFLYGFDTERGDLGG
jgi:hypothetical protein